MDVDVWVRGTNEARTEVVHGVPANAAGWTEQDVRTLLTEMLRAVERVLRPGGDASNVYLRGFSWIVSGEAAGVLVHLEMQAGTASAGPFNIDEPSLTSLITRVMATPESPTTIH